MPWVQRFKNSVHQLQQSAHKLRDKYQPFKLKLSESTLLVSRRGLKYISPKGVSVQVPWVYHYSLREIEGRWYNQGLLYIDPRRYQELPCHYSTSIFIPPDRRNPKAKKMADHLAPYLVWEQRENLWVIKTGIFIPDQAYSRTADNLTLPGLQLQEPMHHEITYAVDEFRKIHKNTVPCYVPQVPYPPRVPMVRVSTAGLADPHPTTPMASVATPSSQASGDSEATSHRRSTHSSHSSHSSSSNWTVFTGDTLSTLRDHTPEPTFETVDLRFQRPPYSSSGETFSFGIPPMFRGRLRTFPSSPSSSSDSSESDREERKCSPLNRETPPLVPPRVLALRQEAVVRLSRTHRPIREETSPLTRTSPLERPSSRARRYLAPLKQPQASPLLPSLTPQAYHLQERPMDFTLPHMVPQTPLGIGEVETEYGLMSTI